MSDNPSSTVTAPSSSAPETPDYEEETPTQTAKSAEDRKAASALAKLDSGNDDAASAAAAKDVDQEAVGKAMKSLVSAGKDAAGAAKSVKVDQADVALLVNELELAKTKATELLKAHDGDAVKAMKAYVTVY